MSIESNREYTCSICGGKFIGWGNNPWPVTEGENYRCCDACNEIHVIPARLERMVTQGSGK